ncbi:MAG: HAMP domain-containing histidine kinase [Myxococcales bacterium]|nr:HAMP domain-containing histidine kinase [Myxococcales bacterium]
MKYLSLLFPWRMRERLALLLGGAVGVSLLLTWSLSHWLVLKPFARDIRQSQMLRVTRLAEEYEQGATIEELQVRHGLELSISYRLRWRHKRGWRRRCHREYSDDRKLVACFGPGGGIAVTVRPKTIPPHLHSSQRSSTHRPRPIWLHVHHPVDPEAPMRGLLMVLFTVAVTIFALSAGIATLVSRPIRASITAMNRMAQGDLFHRLPESGTSELKEVGKAFNRMADRIAALLRAERSLIAGISHEIRTPLTRLRLELEMLKNHPAERLGAMERDINDIDQLVREVIESSRLSIGEYPLHIGPVDLQHVAEEALSQQPLPDHNIELSGESPPILGDHARLVRVLRNLLDNASKYAPKDTLIKISITPATLQVTDEGPGVAPYELPHLFEPFYRASHKQKETVPGYGLGLMIARQIVELHGGTLRAENCAGGGLSVTLQLPVSTDEED